MKDRVAIVTGGNSGIGRAIALALALNGMKVVVAGRRQDANEAVVRELKTRCEADAVAMQVDVTVEAECSKLIKDTVAHFGRLDVLVNSAGVLSVGELGETGTSEVDRVLKTNVYGPIWCAQAAIKAMEQNEDEGGIKGHIINLSSVAGKEGFAGLGTYCASKHALMGFSKCMGEECAEKMIKVSDICPGYVATPMVEEVPIDASEMIQPEDIAKTVLYLLSLSTYCYPREIVVGRLSSDKA